MRNLLFCLIMVAVVACSNTGEEQPSEVAQVSTNLPTAKPKPVVYKADTTKPKRINPYVMTDPSRSIEEINTNFPFDIPLKDASGGMHNSAEILKSNGKPTVVLFWLTTCFPCRIEMKAIQNELDAWKEETDFNIVAISTDFKKNYGNFVKMVEKNNWSFEAYVDVNREFRKVMPGELNGLPQSFIFDKDGKIAYHSRKYSTGDEHKLYSKVKALAAK